jgi:AraC-like DNA-binding protein
MLKHEKIEFLNKLFLSCQSIWSWCYNKDLDLIWTNCPEADSYINLFTNNKKQISELSLSNELPAVIINRNNIAWAITADEMKDENCVYYVLGPVQLKIWTDSSDSLTKSENSLPIVNADEFSRYTSMMHLAVNDTNKNISIYADSEPDNTSFSTHILSQLQIKVRNGDLNYKDLMFSVLSDRSSLLKLGIMTIGSAKELAVLSIDLCCQAAIESGLTKNSVSSLYNQYVPQILKSEDGQEIAQLSNTMIYHLIRLIRHIRGQKVYSLPVQNCCTYIEEHVFDKLSLEYVAKKIGYSADHLSRIFKNEVGEPIKDYIIKLKLYNAKLMLTTTNISIGEISEKLSFCSNSHFTKVFQDYEKKTPLEYRACFTHMV